jgi:hypothetical protein
MKTLAFLFVFLPATIFAAVGPSHLTAKNKDSGGLSAVAMNGAAATRTFTVDLSDSQGMGTFATVVFFFNFVHANNGVISLTCTGGPTDTDKDYILTTCDAASVEGECAGHNAGILRSGTANLTGDKKWEQRLTVRGVKYLSCVAAHGGAPAAGDLLTIKYATVTQ